MINALIALLILILVVGIVAWIIIYLIDLLPIEGNFKQIARVLVMLIAVLVILLRALPVSPLPSGRPTWRSRLPACVACRASFPS
jgi:hypothetical protein